MIDALVKNASSLPTGKGSVLRSLVAPETTERFVRDFWPERAEFQAVEMKPGSVLFVPRGTWHRMRAEQDSFAISITIRPPCAVDTFLDQLKFMPIAFPKCPSSSTRRYSTS